MCGDVLVCSLGQGSTNPETAMLKELHQQTEKTVGRLRSDSMTSQAAQLSQLGSSSGKSLRGVDRRPPSPLSITCPCYLPSVCVFFAFPSSWVWGDSERGPSPSPQYGVQPDDVPVPQPNHRIHEKGR